MRTVVALLIASGLAAAAAADDRGLVTEGERWWARVSVLASDAMAGRETASPGHKAAADYVAAEFKRAGLTPGGVDGSFIQPVKVRIAQIDEARSSLAIVRAAGDLVPLKLGEDATLAVRAGLAERLEADAVFCGYCLTIPEYQYDDFAGLDVKGKIAVFIQGGPGQVPGNLRAHYASGAERWRAAQRAGAIGLLTIQNPKDVEIPWERSTLRRLAPTMQLADDRFSATRGQQFGATLNPARADTLFSTSGHTFAELLAIADQGKQLPRFPIRARIRVSEHQTLMDGESQNVIGILPGSDPALENEYVVFGAHLDHLGVIPAVPGDAKADGIYNGAMDDGSGVASLIEVATLVRDGKLKPKRSLLFVAVTGEEKGLLGSTYFAANPTVPRSAMVAEINMDMYLPLYPLKILEVYGLEESSLGGDIRAVGEQHGVSIIADREPQRRLFIRSDQYSFIKEGIPAIFFKFGWEPGSPEEKIQKAWLRERYHAPSDDLAQPVDKAAAAKYNRIMRDLGLRVADAKSRPRWNDASFFKRFAMSAAAARGEQSPPPSSGLVFDVASVKAVSSTEGPVSGGFLPGGRYQVRNYPLRSLIAAAYLRPQINPDFLIAGGPSWIDSARFDIDARAAGEFPAAPDGPAAPRRVMLQNLLADRFGLRAHLEPREASIFTLTRARTDRLGPGLRPASADCPAAPCGVSIGPGAVRMKRVPITQLVNLLPRFVNRVVVDRTMIEGAMDFELTWTPAPGEWVAPPSAATAPPAPDGPSLVTALEEQLGLRLVSGRGPVDYLVIDSARMPSEN